MDNNNMNFNDNGQNRSNNNFDANNSSSFGSSDNTQNNTENNAQNSGNSQYSHQTNENGTYGNNGYSAPNYNNQYNNQNYNRYGAPNYNGYNNGAYNQGGYNPNGANEGYYYQQAMNSFEEQNRLNESNSTASTSLVFGIIGLVTAFLCYGILLTPLWAILAIVKGAKAQKLAYPQRASAKATVGKIFGIVSLAFTAFIWVLFAFIFVIAILSGM